MFSIEVNILRFFFRANDPPFLFFCDLEHFDFISNESLLEKFISLDSDGVAAEGKFDRQYPFLYLGYVIVVKY